MIVRRLAVLSGIDARVADRMGPALRSMATDVAFVKIGPDGLSSDYFLRLSRRTLEVAQRALLRTDTKLLGLLVSAVDLEEELETDFFFPALRRLSVPKQWRRDVNQSSQIVREIQLTFGSSIYQDVAKYASPQGEDRLLLPIRNTKLDRMSRHFLEIYRMRQVGLTRRLLRDITAMRRGRGYRIRGIDFKGMVNDGTHPIRRCTDSPVCDLRALMRFGVTVPERFEFDVSCSTGLAGKTYYLCDGQPVKVPGGASHLNMRINDDFLSA